MDCTRAPSEGMIGVTPGACGPTVLIEPPRLAKTGSPEGWSHLDGCEIDDGLDSADGIHRRRRAGLRVRIGRGVGSRSSRGRGARTDDGALDRHTQSAHRRWRPKRGGLTRPP